MAQKTYFYEDFTPGREFALGPRHVTAEEIIAFAREFDPQPMHLTEEAGKQSILGGLSASGWHTSGMMMRMLTDSFLLQSTSQGSPGIDFMEWRNPVLAGDTLSGRTIVLEARPLRSRPGIGVVRFRHEIVNQNGAPVCVGENAIMMGMRDLAESAA
jgi:acyl dehydratase